MSTRILLVCCFCLLVTPAAALTVVTDQSAYHQGDLVEFTLTNDGAGPIDLVSDPPFGLLHMESATWLGIVGLPVMTTLQPGGIFHSTHYSSVASDPPGHYEARVDYREAGWPVSTSTTYLMQEPLPQQTTSWGSVKTLYR